MNNAKISRTARMRRNLFGMEFTIGCYMCTGSDDPCTTGNIDGYGTCHECHASGGPSERNCSVAVSMDFFNSITRQGLGPAFGVTGDLEITGILVAPATRKAVRGAIVRLVFPNGICLSTKTDSKGSFNIFVESWGGKRRAAAKYDIGEQPYRTTKDGFVLGFKLDAPLKRVSRPVRAKK